jgi:hypothetical protein
MRSNIAEEGTEKPKHQSAVELREGDEGEKEGNTEGKSKKTERKVWKMRKKEKRK